MSYRKRIKYTDEQKQDIWDRWKSGETMHEIGRSFDRFHITVFGMLSATGGIRPPERQRSHLALTVAERAEISRGLMPGRASRPLGRLTHSAITYVCWGADAAMDGAWQPG